MLMVTTRCGIICKINISKQLLINISKQLPITRCGFKSMDVGPTKSMKNCTIYNNCTIDRLLVMTKHFKCIVIAARQHELYGHGHF